MKTLKLTELDKQDKLNNDELSCLKGGTGIFGWCSCPCCCCCGGTGNRACSRSSDRNGNCRCDDKGGGARSGASTSSL